MPWFKVDDKLHDHRKARRAGATAIGVWTLAGSWCRANNSEGFVPAAVVGRWGDEQDAARLVDAGLWIVAEEDGEKGWQFHDWEEFQPSMEEIRQQKSEAGRKGGQASAQARARKKRQAGAVAGGQARGSASAQALAQAESKPVPVPDQSQSQSQKDYVAGLVSQLQVVGNDGQILTISKPHLTRIADLTGGPPEHVVAVINEVVKRASEPVKMPGAFVTASITAEPDRYRYVRRPPKKHQQCPHHPGQWADTCTACAADRLAEPPADDVPPEDES